ncbi:MAG: HAMP domain-containing protein [Deltaproteobacteria bacterium]|nr:MAG: HAMP domain-containing protein [Deltaproteobacteria bacterium]
MEHPSYQRKTHLIKKDFQIKFIVKFCLIVLAGVILSTTLLFLFSQDTLTSSFDHSKLVIRKTGSAILPAVVYTNLITLGVVCFITIFVTLYISHKIAGPMFRFEKEIKIIGQGDLCNKIVLRKQDQVKEMADSLNQMAQSLHDKVYEIYHEIDIIEQTATEQNNPDQIVDRIKTLKQKIEKNFIL